MTWYTVTFDSCGGTNIEYQMVKEGSLVTEPEPPEKYGCEFTGWYTDDGRLWNFSEDTVQSNMILYAHWNRVTCVVTFDTLGKSVNPPKQILASGSTVVQPAVPTAAWLFFPSWWIFDGWVTGDGVPWNFTTDTVTGDLVLYAQWFFPWWWIVLAVLIVAGIIVLVVYLVKRPKRKQKIITEVKDEDKKP